MTDEALDAYLRALAGEAPDSAYLEIRYRVARDTLAAEFHPAHEQNALAAAIGQRATSTDVYVGCAPRRRRSGTKNDVVEAWVLWAECDGAAAAEAAAAYSPPPSIVVASGSGPNLHAYWPLRRPVSPRDAEHANLRIAYAVGADRACYDAARILRPPGTWNHKRRPPAQVTALRMEPNVCFDAGEVLARAPEIDREPLDRRWAEPPARRIDGDPLRRVPPVVYVGDLLGVSARAGQKVRCPFHSDERPSLHVYATAARGWCCFSCGRGGSIYDLAAAVWLSGQSAGAGGRALRGREFVEVHERLMVMFFGRDAAQARRQSRGRGLGD